MASPDTLVRLNETHVEPAAETLAQAFHEYPVFTYVIPDEQERKENLPALFRAFMKYGLINGEAYATSGGMEGITVWLPPGFGGGLSGDPGIGREALDRFAYYGGCVYSARKNHAPARHWFLELIGVAPESQGKGYAGNLLKPVLERIEREGLPCYLDTELPENVMLYEHFGFKVVDDIMIPGTEIRSWGMLRKSKD